MKLNQVPNGVVWCKVCEEWVLTSKLKFWDGDDRKHYLCPGCDSDLLPVENSEVSTQENNDEPDAYEEQLELERDHSTCIYCHSQMYDGYCWNSPNGQHLHEGENA